MHFYKRPVEQQSWFTLEAGISQSLFKLPLMNVCRKIFSDNQLLKYHFPIISKQVLLTKIKIQRLLSGKAVRVARALEKNH